MFRIGTCVAVIVDTTCIFMLIRLVIDAMACAESYGRVPSAGRSMHVRRADTRGCGNPLSGSPCFVRLVSFLWSRGEDLKVYGCSTVVLIGFTCPAITVATVILRALDRVREVGGQYLPF